MSKSESADVIPFSPLPLHTQIQEALRLRILDGTYKVHQQLPSESELMASFGVSRITVRQALGTLQKEGLIFKIPGKGSFVAKPKAFQDVTRLQGFGEAMNPLGYETCSRLLGLRRVPATPVVAERLGLVGREEVVEIRRLRYLNREPISLDVSYFPLEVAERLMRENLTARDIFLILENECGYRLGEAELTIEAALADEDLALQLKMESGGPMLRIERLTRTWEGRPIDFEYLYYRGDAFRYRLRIGRDGS